MVRQTAQNAGLNNIVATIIGSLVVAGILAVVAMSWDTSLKVATLSVSVGDMQRDLSELKRQLHDDGYGGPNHPKR